MASNALSSTSLHALSLGLNFIPVPQLPTSTTVSSYLLSQFEDYKRRLNIQHFFQLKPSRSTTSNSFRIRSTWQPSEEDFRPSQYSPILKQYLSTVQSRLQQLPSSHQLSTTLKTFLSNYHNPQWLKPALRSLRQNMDIIVTEADKNMGIVVMDRDAYQKEGLRQLSCSNTYRHITNIMIGIFMQPYGKLRTILNKYDRLWTHDFRLKSKKLSSLAEYLLQLESQHKIESKLSSLAAKFYLLMKMHKSPVVGRPIVSTVNSFTYHTSVFVDAELKSLMKLIPSYLESSQQLIYNLETLTLPPDCYICCADIESLYPNIPIDIGMQFVKSAIQRLSWISPDVHCPLRDDNHYLDFILELMEWVLRNNIFKFGNSWYQQLQGTAMGTPLAVPFACLFVAELEHRISSFTPIYYKRYIDDIFMITTSKEEAELFINRFNSVVPTIRCGSVTIDFTTGIFLDIEVYKGSRFCTANLLDVRIYQKVQNRYLYLAPNSFHRRDIFKSTIISELNRYRLCCSNDVEFFSIKCLFFQRLVARGYNPDYLISLFPFHSTRSQLLQNISLRFSIDSKKQSTTSSSLSLPIFKSLNTYETTQLSISKLISIPLNLQNAINDDDFMKQLFSQSPITCFCNADTAYKLIGNARKTLHENE